MNLSNSVVLVTGGSKGIGAATAVACARFGADIIVNYGHDEEAAAGVVAEIRREGRKALAVKADVSRIDEVEAMIDTALKTFPKIGVLVNNAGINKDNYLVLMPQDEWQSVLETNLTGTFNCCKIVAKHMIGNRSGKIINVSSMSGIIGLPGQANYAAAKAGIIGLTRALAKELSHFNISVNAVAPGLIESEMLKKIPEQRLKELISGIPMKRAGTPEEVADVIAFLASDYARYVTGEVIQVAGGL